MKTISIHASKSYDIHIGAGILKDLGPRAAALGKAGSVALVSDDNVFPLYGETVKNSLEEAGLKVFCFVFPHGEQAKCLQVYGQLLEFLDESRLTRSDLVCALGGGVTGDLAGFAAATYLRGIRYIQVPTSLLAMVDSSVGGKTAIDLAGSKNQVGAFWQPSLVVCDTEVLATLPKEQYICGCAEIVKYGVLGSRELFDSVAKTPVKDQAEAIVAACIEMKKALVEEDEFDRGERMKLNLGHTLGHAVEALSDFKLLHGQSVAIGMAAIMRIAIAQGICPKEAYDELLQVYEAYELPWQVPNSADEMADLLLSDKKRSADTLKVVLPEGIGSCRIGSVPTSELKAWMALGGIR